jgi:hypothetical protein
MCSAKLVLKAEAGWDSIAAVPRAKAISGYRTPQTFFVCTTNLVRTLPLIWTVLFKRDFKERKFVIKISLFHMRSIIIWVYDTERYKNNVQE